MYDSIIFDVDGVLLQHHPNTPAVYLDAVAEAFRTFDRQPPRADLDAFVGTATVDAMQGVCDRHDVAFEQFWRERERQVSAHQQMLMERGDRSLFEDAAVVEDLAATHRLGITSNNQQETVDFMVEHFDLGIHFDVVYGRTPSVDGFACRKPDPHYVERTLTELDTQSALFVGDSEADVLAADAAGLDAAYVQRRPEATLETEIEPRYVLDTLTELTDIVQRGERPEQE